MQTGIPFKFRKEYDWKETLYIDKVYLMKKLTTLLLAVILPSLISGCQTVRNAVYCSNKVDKEIPPITELRYVRTDTVCTNSGTSGKVRENGNISIDSSTTSCKSSPVYETVTLNESQRAEANKRCMNFLDTQQSTVQSSQNGCNDAWGRISSSNQVNSLKYLLTNNCVGKQSFGWKDKMTNESSSGLCRQHWDLIEKSGKINDAQYLVTHRCTELQNNLIY